MAIAFGSLLTTGTSATANITTASVTPTAGDVVFVSLYMRSNTGTVTLSGNGLTWTKQTITNYSGTEYYLFTGTGTPSAGTITSSGGNGASTNLWIVQTFTGVDTSSPVVQTNYSSGTSTTLSTTLGSSITAGNTGFGFGWTRNQPTFTAGSGFTLNGNANESAGARTMQNEYYLNKTNNAVIDMTINTSQAWTMIGAEIRATGSGTSTGNFFLVF